MEIQVKWEFRQTDKCRSVIKMVMEIFQTDEKYFNLAVTIQCTGYVATVTCSLTTVGYQLVGDNLRYKILLKYYVCTNK